QLVHPLVAGDRGEPTEVRATWQRTFGAVPVGEPLLYEDSSGTISLSDNQGDIATRLGLVVDQPARIRSA
ncbi:MAG TPA: SAM hydroxide adenosyltransferase, partial [Candidatus Limnocylindrales bacterium]